MSKSTVRDSLQQSQPVFLIAGRWKLIRKIGSGSFGEIFLGINNETGEEVAIKLEKATARHPQLYFESKVYRILTVRS